MTTFRVGSATDVGRIRDNNQDSFLVADHLQLYAVADGMGGHQGGEVASAMAVEQLERHPVDRSLAELKEGVRLANRLIFERQASDEALHGMGTTLCAIALVDGIDGGDEVAWVNVGDSRVYLFRDGELIQLSEDHSLVESLVREGQLTPEEAAVHPRRNIITRALGIELDVEVDGNTVIPFRGDRFVLSSDGLFNEVDENRMAGVLRRLADPDEAAAELVRLANEHGGRDNITVVIAEVVDDEGSAAASAAIAADATTVATGPIESHVSHGPADEEHQEALYGRRSSLPSAADDDVRTEVDDLYRDLDGARVRHLTWRVVAFVLVIVVVLGAAVGAIGWQARHTYFVGFADDEVTIFKGRPGGVLWFNPTVEQRMGIRRTKVPAARVKEIADGKDAATIADARRYVSNLREQILRAEQARRPSQAVLPDVIGLSEATARAKLEQAGFTKVTSVPRPDPSAPKGVVIRTDPPTKSGSSQKLSTADPVVLAVSTGKAATTTTTAPATTAPTTTSTTAAQPGG